MYHLRLFMTGVLAAFFIQPVIAQYVRSITNAPVSFDYVLPNEKGEYDLHKIYEHWERDSNGSLYQSYGYLPDGDVQIHYKIDDITNGCHYTMYRQNDLITQHGILRLAPQWAISIQGKTRTQTLAEVQNNEEHVQEMFSSVPYSKDGAVYRKALGELTVNGMKIYGRYSEDSRDPGKFRVREEWWSELGFLYSSAGSTSQTKEAPATLSGGQKAFNIKIGEPPKEHFLFPDSLLPHFDELYRAQSIYVQGPNDAGSLQEQLVAIMTRSQRWNVVNDRTHADLIVRLEMQTIPNNPDTKHVNYSLVISGIQHGIPQEPPSQSLLRIWLTMPVDDESIAAQVTGTCFTNLWQRVESAISKPAPPQLAP